MKKLPNSIPHSVADHYQRDARDFARRFDFLWEELPHRNGRIKSFVDLYMGCECALKCHIFLGPLTSDPMDTYKIVRKAGHDIKQLAQMANFVEDRSIYRRLEDKLAPFSVFIRYSLDACSIFSTSKFSGWARYSATIGTNSWVLSVRDDLQQLMDAAGTEFSGEFVFDANHFIKMENFLRTVAPRKWLTSNKI